MTTDQASIAGQIIREKIHPADLSEGFIGALRRFNFNRSRYRLYDTPETAADLILATAIRLAGSYGLGDIVHRREEWPADWRSFDWVERVTDVGMGLFLLIGAIGQAQELLRQAMDTRRGEMREKIEKAVLELYEMYISCEREIREARSRDGKPFVVTELERLFFRFQETHDRRRV